MGATDLVSAWADPAQVEAIARKTLDQEEGDLPPFYIPILTRYFKLYPYDANFILELAEKGKAWTGGNGFGTVTCMDCWKDIILDADPTRPKGGKDEGLGSLYNYQVHCQEEDHLKGRNERLQQLKIAPPPVSSSIPDLDAEEPPLSCLTSTSSSAGLSAARIPFSPSTATRLSTRSTSPSRPLRDLDGNLPDVKPGTTVYDKGKGKAREVFSPIYVSSGEEDDLKDDDSDSDVEVLDASKVPSAFKRVTNQANPFLVDSDDEDELPSSAISSQMPRKFISSTSNQPLAPIFSSPAKVSSSQAAKVSHPRSAVKAEPTPAPNTPHAAITGPSTTTKVQPHTASTTTGKSTQMPGTWYENELAHLHNEAARRRGRHGDLYKVDPYRPRLQTIVTTTPGLDTKQFARSELAVMHQVLRLTKGGLQKAVMDRILSLNQIAALGGCYLAPELRILLLAKYELEPLWERLCPRNYSLVPRPHENAIAGPSQSNGQVRHELGTPVPTLAQAFAEAIRSGVNSIAGLDMASIGLPGAYPMPRYGFGPDDEDHDFGYEYDRPRNAEALADLFKTALDDFQEDTDVETALKGLGLQRLEDRIPGLKIQLMPHQVLGVHWMIQQEKKTSCQGGILGDQMGLGKTVQAIATMVKNPSEDRKLKTTLIVVPLPLVQQWKAEIEAKSGLSVLIHHGPNRTKSSNHLKTFDCVITTYAIVSSDASDLIVAPKKKKKKAREDDWIDDDEEDVKPKSLVKKKGPLFRVKWYRIILDEAAIVRNKATKASKAVLELEGDKRWCLTGTLIYNTLSDIYPYLRFIGIIDWEDFRNQVHLIASRKPRLASRRAQALLRKVMLRRTKESELHGKKILQLPPKTIDMVELDFTEEERAIYTAIETAARVKVNKWYKAGTLLKQYHVVLVMLTRLRQFCCHPWLLRASEEYQATHEAGYVGIDDGTEAGPTTARLQDLKDADYLERATRAHGQEWVDKVKSKLEERHQQFLDEAEEEDANDSSCPICFDTFTDEVITSCVHSFCSTCINGILDAPPRDGMVDDVVARDARPCPICRSEVKRDDIYPAKAFFDPDAWQQDLDEEADEELDVKPFSVFVKQEPGSSAKRKRSALDEVPDIKRVKIEGKGKAKAEPDADDEDGNLDNVDIEDVLPSTKMKRIADLLAMWDEVDSTQKTLIFCSFVEMLELMGVYLRKKGIKYVLYTGKMKTDDRDEAIRQFSQAGEDTPKVMLISLKCGGVGLNLTAANNVIGLDLAWSPASEAQAVDRAHRIGQTRPVSVKRLIVRDSVEQRILALQEKKQMITDGAMGEGDGGRLPRLSARDLLHLFGAQADD